MASSSSPAAAATASTAAGDLQQQQQQQQQPSTILTYPLPPLQYINNIDPDNLPQPPPPITDGVYFMFGQKISLDDAIIAPLEAHGTKRLFPRSEYDHKKELKKINASILVNFLDLIDVLVKCPDTDKRIEKCNDLATLFINFHHLINELRPHQARETLRVWLTAQKRTREEITKKLNNEMDKIAKILDNYAEYEKANNMSNNVAASKSIETTTHNKHQQSDAAYQFSEPGEQVTNTMLATTSTSTTTTAAAAATTTATTTTSLDDIMCQLIDE